jgi:hypothetical protein
MTGRARCRWMTSVGGREPGHDVRQPRSCGGPNVDWSPKAGSSHSMTGILLASGPLVPSFAADYGITPDGVFGGLLHDPPPPNRRAQQRGSGWRPAAAIRRGPSLMGGGTAPRRGGPTPVDQAERSTASASGTPGTASCPSSAGRSACRLR